jgi:hypothetical protein
VGDATGRSGTAALTALQFALAQLGKPYEWGAEGPSTYDCSGLVQTAYAAAGIGLPRTARQQYLSTNQVAVTALLPGDLLYFATDRSDWNTIHHIAIYLGDGMMLHAPTTGDVVKISPVWWAEFFGATRAVPGVNGPSVVIPIPGLPSSVPSTVPGAVPSRPPAAVPSRPPAAVVVPSRPPAAVAKPTPTSIPSTVPSTTVIPTARPSTSPTTTPSTSPSTPASPSTLAPVAGTPSAAPPATASSGSILATEGTN